MTDGLVVAGTRDDNEYAKLIQNLLAGLWRHRMQTFVWMTLEVAAQQVQIKEGRGHNGSDYLSSRNGGVCPMKIGLLNNDSACSWSPYRQALKSRVKYQELEITAEQATPPLFIPCLEHRRKHTQWLEYTSNGNWRTCANLSLASVATC